MFMIGNVIWNFVNKKMPEPNTNKFLLIATKPRKACYGYYVGHFYIDKDEKKCWCYKSGRPITEPVIAWSEISIPKKEINKNGKIL